ncbi:hypothetical protein Sste5346_005537 [Sporothrix stenoceras]|uniref:Uncharacterized protein n=1 Tax=Sporothrix stenoceras TaxID=5173 RepID=A0ABR3Z2K5_9PEZI
MSRDDSSDLSSILASYEHHLQSFNAETSSNDDFEERRRKTAQRLEMIKTQVELYVHRHEILVVADVHAEAQPVSVTLYDWASLQQASTSTSTSTPATPTTIATTSSCETFSVKEPGSALAHVKGYFDLGTIRLPGATTSIADLLLDEAQDDEYDFCNDADTDADSRPLSLPQLVRRLRQRLANETSTLGRGRPVQLWSIPVQSKIADNVFGDKDKKYLWHWYKPTSPYSIKGTWETELDAVLENGSWQAGRELILILRRVSPEVWQSYVDGCPSLHDLSADTED